MRHIFCGGLLASALVGPSAARAAAPEVETWAIVIGSNRAGPGQATLRYAGADADRVAAVLNELGDVSTDRLLRLKDPSPGDVLAALSQVDDALSVSNAAHRRLVFYYSGHARSGGLDLGDQVLSLGELRRELEALSADVRVVVLDACQSGAMSGAKGLDTAAAFSTASVQGLQTEGIAVIASSAADELSQESEAIQGSYFTQHFVVGLRGAADGDVDGHVTLDEAYRYAYDRTVVSTASTAIGRQHPSLETDLQGRGSLTLTRPERASARLRFGPDDQGTVLLIDNRTGVVSAELDKAGGDTLTLSMAPGEYEVVWTQKGRTDACVQVLPAHRTTDFDPKMCNRVDAPDVVAKGSLNPGAKHYETVFVEVGYGPFTGVNGTDFQARLGDFGFEVADGTSRSRLLPAVLASVTLDRHLAVVGQFSALDGQRYARDASKTADGVGYEYGSLRAGLGVRAKLPLVQEWVVPYGQVTAGPVRVSATYGGQEDAGVLGLFGAIAGGAQFMPRLGNTRLFGLFVQGEVQRATGLRNLLDERQELGGTQLILGLRVGV